MSIPSDEDQAPNIIRRKETLNRNTNKNKRKLDSDSDNTSSESDNEHYNDFGEREKQKYNIVDKK